MIRVSVIVPNYNSGPVLERCLRSIRDQNYEALEVIVVDALSSDNSCEVIGKHTDLIDKLIREKDDGQADGINKGFRHATGEVFCWLCADDEFTPGALDRVAKYFTEQPQVDVALGMCERLFPDGSTTITPARPDTWQVIGRQNVIDQPSIFWRRSLHERLGELDTSYGLAFDWDFWCRMRDQGAVLQTVDQILSRYYFTETNKSGSAGRLHVDESFRILRRYGPLRGLLAYVYLFLYYQFDLKGCYDHPPSCTRFRLRLFVITRFLLKLFIDERLIDSYNWHFASCQERKQKWW